MVVLSGYASDLYATRLVGWQTHTFRAKTHVDTRDEVLWCNFEPPAVLHDACYLGADFHGRQAIKRRLRRLKVRISRMPPAERAVIREWMLEQHLEPTEVMSAQSATLVTRTGAMRLELPSADEEVMPGVRWGAVETFPTPAYWLCQVLGRRLIGNAIRYKLGRSLTEEVCASPRARLGLSS